MSRKLEGGAAHSPGLMILVLLLMASSPLSVSAARNEVRIREKDGYRIILSNGIPDHRPGQFPNRGNPHILLPQEHEFRVPLKPRLSARPYIVPPHLFGVAINGIPFDPGTAEFWNDDRRSGWNYEALSGRINLGVDHSNAHVQPDGTYHYHGIPQALYQARKKEGEMTLVGYGADGYPVYVIMGYQDPMDPSSALEHLHSSYQLREGLRPSGTSGPGHAYDGTFVQDFEYVAGSGDLDECNGRFGVTPEHPDGTYYYVLTTEFPFIPRLWRGEPDRSFQKQMPGGMGQGPGGPLGGHSQGRPPPGGAGGGLGHPPPHRR